jgi:hypothetical protein
MIGINGGFAGMPKDALMAELLLLLHVYRRNAKLGSNYAM